MEETASEVEQLRQRLNILQDRVLDIITTALRVKLWRRTAIVVSVLAIGTIGVGLYFSVATHNENHHLAHVEELNAQVNLDFNEAITCLASGTPASQRACEVPRIKTLFADEATLEHALQH